MTKKAGEMLSTQIVPRIRASFPVSIKTIGAEDAAELIQDTIAHAAAMLHSTEATGKKVAASTVAYFAVKLTRCGRRSTHSSTTDVMHPGTHTAGRARVVSFDEPLVFLDETTGDPITLADIFDNGQDDPSMLAARSIDWETFYKKQTTRGQRLLAGIAEGSTLREVARFFDLSDSGMQVEKRKMAAALREFMGADILAEVNRQPMWRDNLTANRERQACRAARV
jgi:hypothetical protein